MQGIYKIVNKVNGKYYVGSTQDLEQGLVDRREWLRKNKHYNPRLQYAWNRYGEETFAFEIGEEIEGDNKALLSCEQGYLDVGFALGILYNIARKAGGGNLGEEVSRKQSKALTGREITWGAKIGAANKGRIPWNKGKTGIYSDDTLLAMGIRHKQWHVENDHPRLGTHITEEERQKQRESHLGHKHSEETKQKMKESWNGAENNAQPYPAFYNVIIEEHIPAGVNFSKMCRERGLNYDKLYDVKMGRTKCTRDGWRLACLLNGQKKPNSFVSKPPMLF